MTMVVVDTQPDRVTVMRDGSAYTADGSRIEAIRKDVVRLPGIAAVTTSRGDRTLGDVWESYAAPDLAGRCGTFDLFVLAAPTALRGVVDVVHKAVAETGFVPPGDAPTFHVYASGWSLNAGRFVSWVLRSENDFTPEPIEPVHVTPAPAGTAWTQVERRRWDELADAFAVAGVTQPDIPAGTPEPPPTDDGGWIDLARRIHRSRACAHPHTGLKVIVGGIVTLTTLTGQGIDGRDLFTFTHDEHARVIADTRAAEPASSSKVGRNDPCPCGSGTKHKRCCALVPA